MNEYNSLISSNNLKQIPKVPDLVTDETIRAQFKQTEIRRIHYDRMPENSNSLNCLDLMDFVQKSPGPRLLIVNTVQTAAVIAQAMRKSGHNVLHLSTALAPAHRDLVIERIKSRLHNNIENWTLVATSCVEAGMNFSFRTGFRERSSTASLIQIGGRVNRSDKPIDAKVWDILIGDDRFRSNPAISISCRALDDFTLEELNTKHPAELATIAMRREWTFGAEDKAIQLIKNEDKMEYPSVSKECHVINTDTRIVVVDSSLADAIRKGDKVSKDELMKYSVQIWATKIEKLGLEPITHKGGFSDSDIYEWKYEYDPDFLGYMKGVLKLDEFIASGGAII